MENKGTCKGIVSELTYRSYAHNRMISPEITPERWAKVFAGAAQMEERFQKEKTK